MNAKIRILLIAFSDSIHISRWIEQMDRSKYEVILFPSVPFGQIHGNLKDIQVYQLQKDENDLNDGIVFNQPIVWYRLFERMTGAEFAKRIISKLCKHKTQKQAIVNSIRRIRPDIVHTMETQQAGYLMSDVFQRLPYPLVWIHSTWGIDLHFYKDIPHHRDKLRKLLSKISLLVVEGERDKLLAEELGYKGISKIIPSVGGGFDFDQMDKIYHPVPPSQRKKIMLKGYEDHERVASTALQALRKLSPMLTGYEVIVYSCSSKLLPIISDIQRQNEFQISYYADMAHDDLLEKTCSARISITNNLSDGVPNTMLEAMALGAFPIQSNTAITEGWIEDGKNGLLTNPRDINQIAEAISKALTDDRLVDDAAVLNGRLVREKLNFNTIKTQIEDLYKTASGKSKTVAH